MRADRVCHPERSEGSEILREAFPELKDEILRGACPELNDEILRSAQNDNEGLRMTEEGIRMTCEGVSI